MGVGVDDEAPGRRLPGPGVGARTWGHGDAEADGGVGEPVVCPVRAEHLGGAVGPEELGRLGGGVAGELEALAEAAGLGAERVAELGVPAAGGAARKGGSGRDRQDPITGAGDSRRSPQAQQQQQKKKLHDADELLGGRAHR